MRLRTIEVDTTLTWWLDPFRRKRTLLAWGDPGMTTQARGACIPQLFDRQKNPPCSVAGPTSSPNLFTPLPIKMDSASSASAGSMLVLGLLLDARCQAERTCDERSNLSAVAFSLHSEKRSLTIESTGVFGRPRQSKYGESGNNQGYAWCDGIQ